MASLVSNGVPLLLMAAIVGGGMMAVKYINRPEEADTVITDPDSPASEVPSVLSLSEGKLDAGQLQTEAVGEQLVQHIHVVPGRIRYDESQHIDIKAPMDGILTEVLVKPGDSVEAGKLLAVLSSPEIGQARAEVLKRQAQLDLVQRQLNRELSVGANLKEFLAQLDASADFESLDAKFSNRPLGNYRQQLLGAYSRLKLASELNENLRPLVGTGSVPERTIRERQSESQIARAEYRSAREQAAFDASQAELQAQADVADAERLLRIARQQLETLLGYAEPEVDMDSQPSLSRLEIRAPFEGTIESRSMARSERVSRSDSLFVLANTNSLYIAADIRENDWPAVSLQTGTKVVVTVPAIADREFHATVHYVGREVVAETNAVPLVATIDNSDGLLRPGMFVRVALPNGAARRTLAIRPESVLHQDQDSFVFVSLKDNTFQKVDIKTGLSSDEWVEVTSGLERGQMVVRNGAFLLKSELLLEGEAE